MSKSSVKVKGMSCQHCVGAVTEALEKLEGVGEVKVDLASGTAEYEEKSAVSVEDIKAAIEAVGFEVGS
ncbi:MAG: heavy-metal-associated domain-containing protein [Desulfovibrio sp.]|uniref:heavy-metal-associated domain-containing protein n=1 Tax=Desulfovibrio sp. 7SRBS1 TaxID=3378064 RepID=UPI003B3E4905